MPAFVYRAKGKDRKLRSGKVDAANKSEAKAFLRKRGLNIISISPQTTSNLLEGEVPILGEYLVKDQKGNYILILGKQDPNAKDIIIFTKQLATMVGSGVPLIQSLGILERQQSSRGFRKALVDIRETLENGATFSAALSKYPHIFDTLYISMVAAGEASGNLDIILKKLVVYIEKAEKIKSQVKSAMAYPIIVMVIALVVVSGLLYFVVPVFAKQYAETGRKLPDLTQAVIDVSDGFKNNFLVIAAGFASFIYAFRTWKNSKGGRVIFDKYILRAPIIGDVLKKIAVGRFCSTMASMLGSGVNLLQALSICAASAGNKVIELFVLNVKTGLEKGQNFSTPLSEGDLFPLMVISMVQVGEQTGSLDEMLTKVSELYEDEVDTAVKTMLSMIEPIMIVFIGGIVAFIVLAMYLPVFEMAGGID